MKSKEKFEKSFFFFFCKIWKNRSFKGVNGVKVLIILGLSYRF